MKNEMLASVLSGILFGFSSLLMILNKEEYVSAALLGISALMMMIYAYSIRKKKSNCTLKPTKNEN